MHLDLERHDIGLAARLDRCGPRAWCKRDHGTVHSARSADDPGGGVDEGRLPALHERAAWVGDLQHELHARLWCEIEAHRAVLHADLHALVRGPAHATDGGR